MNEQSSDTLPSIFENGDAYDLMLADISYGVDYYSALARNANGPVLEVACGTGRILLPCLQAGVDIDGLDLFEPMLKTLRSKAASLQVTPQLYQQDMSNFTLPRRYRLIMIPFNAFIHNASQEAQIGCLLRCREHLLPGGELVFDTTFPSMKIIGAPQGARTLEKETAHPTTGLPMRIYITRRFDYVAQTQYALSEFELLARDGTVQTNYRSQVKVRYIYKHEMELLLRVAGFAQWRIFGDFHSRPMSSENDTIVVVARKE
jgi:SAM-dependent methyltransferase